MQPLIFLGPTLSIETASKHLDAIYCPPAQQGDILSALPRKPFVIGIIDGYFETVPTIWHKEILYAMSRGVHVFGASSLGALRAAELEAFGMVGVGQIFEWYRSGVLEDDDEVAVTHGPAETGYVAVSEAMVNIRHSVAAAIRRGRVSEDFGTRIIAVAKSLHYSHRNYRRIWELIYAESDGVRALDLLAFLEEDQPKLKELDAILLLQNISSFIASNPGPNEVSYVLERTVFLDAMINEAERKCAAIDAICATDVQQFDFDLLRHEVLLRILARREATRLGLDCTEDELREGTEVFARELALDGLVAMQEDLDNAGIEQSSFLSLMKDGVLLGKLDFFYDQDIRSSIADHLRIRTFRQTARAKSETAG